MQKKVRSILRGVLYGVLLVIFFVLLTIPAIYMNTIYGYVPVFCVGILLVISVLSLHMLQRSIHIASENQDLECERGSDVSVGLNIVNPSRIYCPKLVANVFISDLFSKKDAMTQAYFTIPPRDTANLGFDMDMSHIGVYQVGIDDMELYDFFGFFKKRLRVQSAFEVFVTPKIRDLEEIQESTEATAESNHESRTTIMNGTDYVGVREYEMGDSMKQIHWKLSAHTKEYMTRMYESSRQMDYTVILDFAAERNEDREELMELNDCLIETALSIIEHISRQHTQYSLLYTNGNREISRMSVKGLRHDLRSLIRDFAVICQEPDVSFPDALQILMDENNQANRSTNVIICTSRVTEALIQEMLHIKRQRRNPELYVIHPARLNVREMEAKKALLHHFDEAALPYHFVSTQENKKAHSIKKQGGIQ